jgi:YD repeat-containing protein
MRALLAGAIGLLALWSAYSFAATTYTYDNLGRVKTATYDNGKQITYSYDDAGNRSQVVTQAGTNRPPQANNDWVTIISNMSLSSFDARVNDTDPDGDSLAITSVGSASHGTATNTTTSVSYTPTSNYVGSDSFTYTISDSNGHTASATVYVTVVAATPPIAVNDVIATGANTAKQFDPRSNDTDRSGLGITITATTTPANGTATHTTTSVTYTPATNYEGPDSFNYTITDGKGQTATATVSATVGAPPVAQDDFMPVPTSTAVTFDPRVNDSDPFGFPITVTAVGTATHGTAAINNGVSITYTPATGYSGPDSFTYTISNSNGLQGQATDHMCVGPVLPVAVNDDEEVAATHENHVPITPSGTFGLLGNDSDPCQQSLAIISLTQPAKGTVNLNPDGTVTYLYYQSVDGILHTTDTFTYTVADPFGGSATATVTVHIDIEIPT